MYNYFNHMYMFGKKGKNWGVAKGRMCVITRKQAYDAAGILRWILWEMQDFKIPKIIEEEMY